MKRWLMSAGLLTIGVLAAAQSSGSAAIHIDPGKVAEALAKGETRVANPGQGAWRRSRKAEAW